MNFTTAAAAAAFAMALSTAAPAVVQTTAPAPTAGGEVGLPSKDALKAVQELKAAVDAKDAASIPAKLAAARAAAKTAEDRYWVALLEYMAVKDSNNPAAKAAAIEALLASGKVKLTDVRPLTLELAEAYQRSNQLDKAAATLERLLANSPDRATTMALAKIRKDQGRVPDAVAVLRKSISAAAAAGAKADEQLYRYAVQLAYDARLPAAPELAREWVQAYPSADSWRNGLRIYRDVAKVGDDELIDLLRLHRATGSLVSEADHYKYALWGITKGFPGEAKAVLEEGFAAKHIERSKAEFADVYKAASNQAAGDRGSLDASAQTARAGTAKQALAAGDAYYGYGEFAKAAELYRAAFAKPGADKDLINLRLGAALARAGDKAGATSALNAVTGHRAELARFWLIYAGNRT